MQESFGVNVSFAMLSHQLRFAPFKEGVLTYGERRKRTLGVWIKGAVLLQG